MIAIGWMRAIGVVQLSSFAGEQKPKIAMIETKECHEAGPPPGEIVRSHRDVDPHGPPQIRVAPARWAASSRRAAEMP
jgi:hypothetical protein